MAIPTLLLAAALVQAAAAAPQEADPLAQALSIIGEHQVVQKVGCQVPLPAIWNAPPWEQQAAAFRRQAFQDCLARVMEREQQRLQDLTYRVDDLRVASPGQDWSGVDDALDAKWAELESVEQRLQSRERWADTAVTIVDTFTGPGAPFDSSPLNPRYSNPYSPFGPATPSFPYRRDSSVSMPGIK